MKTSRVMMTVSRLAFALLTFVSASVELTSDAQTSTQRSYAFKVFLDDDEIGEQRFLVSPDGERTRITVEAKFDVNFWIITAYSYRHTNVEVWEGGCLREIRAKTNDNGDTFFVRGQYQKGQMQLVTHAGQESVKGCVKTFAYWNPTWFQSDRLLNSQTGELQPVDITVVGEETISVRGAPTRTRHLRILSDKFTIDLWYTMNDDWVALQSTTENGGKLRYQLL